MRYIAHALLGLSLLVVCVAGDALAGPAGKEFRVNTYKQDAQQNPSVAALKGGSFVVTWHSNGQDGDGWGVYGQRYNKNGKKAGKEFRVNTYTQDWQWHPSVAGLKGGGFVVTWQSILQDGSGSGVYGQRYNKNGKTVGGEFLVNTYTQNNQYYPSVAGLEGGGFVVTWESVSQAALGADVYGQRYNKNGKKAGKEFLVNTYTQAPQWSPSVAALKGGGFVVTWHSSGQDGSGYGVYGQRYNKNGKKAGKEFRVNTYTQANQDYPSVAGLKGGGFVVTWQSGHDGSVVGVFGQRYNTKGKKAGKEFLVNTFTVSYQLDPSVAGLKGGGFVVTWEADQDGSGLGIYGQRYTRKGKKAGKEFRVNTYKQDAQQNPSVAGLKGGGFVVTWQSDGQDGSADGIYGQRYK